MKRFLDSNGKQWEIDVHLASLERVNDACGIDLTQLFGDGLTMLSKLFDDAGHLTKVLWCLCGPEQGDEGKAEFLKAMRGDALEAGANALVDAVIDFFPNARRRELCRAAVEKMWATVTAGQDLAERKLAEIEPASLVSAGRLAELLESIPDISPSANSA